MFLEHASATRVSCNTMLRRGLAIPALLSSFVLLAFFFTTKWSHLGRSQTGDLAGLSRHPSNTATGTYSKDVALTHNAVTVAPTYFDQAFSPQKQVAQDLLALHQACHTPAWSKEHDIYLRCGAMAAGMTSIVSQVKTCFKMAVDAGLHLVLPEMPLRSSTDLTNFNFLDPDAHMLYDKWFDVEHLLLQMKHNCPRMKIIRPEALDSTVPVKYNWNIDISHAPNYAFGGTFWVGETFASFFEKEFETLTFLATHDKSNTPEKLAKTGATIITIAAEFLLFRIADDPTGHDRRLWHDLAHVIRFRQDVRNLVHRLLKLLDRPFYGVHFRVENDTIWSPLEDQLTRDITAIDQAWELFGRSTTLGPGFKKPLVYLACGDLHQISKFVAAGAAKGWEVTHKWDLAKQDPVLRKAIDEMPFDFQGAVDMGVMLKSDFFLGITGSAFSSTIANLRDSTGRYRGSSLRLGDDGGARSHLFTDGSARSYPCCL